MFIVSDVVGVLNVYDDYTKNRNYQEYLKYKLKADNVELVSATNQLRMTTLDGKKRLTDVLDASGIVQLAKSIPKNQAASFIEWFTNGENPVDGKGKVKAYEFFESSLLESIELSMVKVLRQRSCIRLWRITSGCWRGLSFIKRFLQESLTDKVDEWEIFMKGIDYSYYQEEQYFT